MLLCCHFGCDFLYIFLAFDINSGNAWQIDNCQVRTVVRMDSELDWIVNNVTAFSRNFISKFLDVHSYFIEVVIFFCWIILKNCVRLSFRSA